jgi:hypothetical protein
MSETCLSVEAQGDNAASHSDGRLCCIERRSVGIAVLLEQFRRGCRPTEFVRVCFVPASLDLRKLFLALKKLVDWIECEQGILPSKGDGQYNGWLCQWQGSGNLLPML